MNKDDGMGFVGTVKFVVMALTIPVWLPIQVIICLIKNDKSQYRDGNF